MNDAQNAYRVVKNTVNDEVLLNGKSTHPWFQILPDPTNLRIRRQRLKRAIQRRAVFRALQCPQRCDESSKIARTARLASGDRTSGRLGEDISVRTHPLACHLLGFLS